MGEVDPSAARHTEYVVTDTETWPAFREDEDFVSAAVAETGPRSADAAGRLAEMERLEGEALARRFQALDRQSEQLAAEQQRAFAARLDAAIAGELAELRRRREDCETRLAAWEAAERQRITAGVALEEQRFGERLMAQLAEFERQLGERAREQEAKLAGWWSEAERLAEQRMRGTLEDVEIR